MNTEYLPSFIKELKQLKKTPVYEEIKLLAFQTIPNCSDITEIRKLKKLKTAKNAYRIRVGDYGISISIRNKTVISRVLNRKDIYHFFP